MSNVFYLDESVAERELIPFGTPLGRAMVCIETMDTISIEISTPEHKPANFNGIPVVYARIEASLKDGRFKAGLDEFNPRVILRGAGYSQVHPRDVLPALRELERSADSFASLFPSKFHDRAVYENRRTMEVVDKMLGRIRDVLGAVAENEPERVYLP